jgi:hypothetical protein
MPQAAAIIGGLHRFYCDFCSAATVFISKSMKRLAHGFKTRYTAKLYRILRRGHVSN